MRIIYPMALAMALGLATMPTAAQAGATVSNDGLCAGFVPTIGGQEGAPITTTESHTWLKGNGSSSVTCHFDIPAALIPAQTTRARGFPCTVIVGGNFLGITTDTRMLASSGGRATLTCRISTGG